MNKGVCRPLLNNYTCECLGKSYSGRHCKVTAKNTLISNIVSKIVAYIAILIMTVLGIFIVVMDIIKHCFGIDPVHEEREKIRREKQARKQKTLVFHRFVYVNATSIELEELATPTEELSV